MVARIGCVLLMAWALDAQTGSGGNGWSQQGSLEQADAIVIGEITGGEGVDRFSSVQAQATLHVRRVIKGAPAPETDLKLAWQYRPSPMEGPDVTTRVKPVYGLWLLRAATDGTWRPLPVATGPMDMGGVYLALPRVELTG
ncbi:MAG: hypothetical protein M1436_02890, partial [Acidobacteria bacterium]|nr:hypothetical protein [Acidobacteriota bacterium]